MYQCYEAAQFVKMAAELSMVKCNTISRFLGVGLVEASRFAA